MTFRLYIILSIFGIFLFHACDNKSGEKTPDAGKEFSFGSSAFEQSLKNAFISYNTFSIPDSAIQYLDTLQYFYKQRNFHSVFFENNDHGQNREAIINLFDKANEHGLSPEWYHASALHHESEFLADKNNIGKYDYSGHLTNFEILLADGLLKYASHLRYGVVNPMKVFRDGYFLPYPDSSKIDQFAPLYAPDIHKYLLSIQPASGRYKKLQAALQHFSTMKVSGWKIIHPVSEKLQLGTTSPIIPGIIDRLVALNFIDTNSVKIFNRERFDTLISHFIAKFQKTQGLIPDGVPGKSTIDKLNIPPTEYVNRIKLNLDRFRWNNYTNLNRYLLVNIPDFYLHLMENQKETFTIKICTGRKRSANYYERFARYLKTRSIKDRPDNWETPQLSSEIFQIILNPTWTVPTNIIREEIYREVMKDPNYLQKRNFRAYKNNKEVDLKDIDLKKYQPGHIPFSFVQGSGPGNALGRIKFMFKNKFDVYLHDTPTRGPFSNSNRAVSHGCMRVEKPMILAEYLLRNHSKWNMDYLKCEIGQPVSDKQKVAEYKLNRNALRRNMYGAKHTEIALEQRLPIFIDYITAWVDDSGVINLRDDIYGKDKTMANYFP